MKKSRDMEMSKSKEMLEPFGIVEMEEISVEEEPKEDEGLMVSAEELLKSLEKKDPKMLLQALKDLMIQMKSMEEEEELEDEEKEM